jgi:hypothetical protein
MDSKSGKSRLFGLGRGPAGRQGLRRWNECEKGGEPGTGEYILRWLGKQNGNSGSVCFVLVAVSLVAAYLPARSASKLDPMKVLHEE